MHWSKFIFAELPDCDHKTQQCRIAYTQPFASLMRDSPHTWHIYHDPFALSHNLFATRSYIEVMWEVAVVLGPLRK